MFILHGTPFMQHTYLHHLTRIDHRHNFSPYNTLLYLSSAKTSGSTHLSSLRFESLAFIPQLVLSTVLIPISISKSSLPRAMLAQTFAFVTFNKVCTSQYFLWYLIFLPIYLPSSVLIRNPALGLSVLGGWVAGQALWLWQGYNLEMLGQSTFVPGLWLSSLLFFAVNCWILGVIVSDHGQEGHDPVCTPEKERDKLHASYPQELTLKDEGVDGVESGENEDGNDSDVEEIPRAKTVEQLVREEMRRRRGTPLSAAPDPSQTRQTDTLLSQYMADIQSFDPDQ